MTRYRDAGWMTASACVAVLGGMACGLDDDRPVTAGAAEIISLASGLPVPPGGGVPTPSGTPTNLKVLDWAGFKGAVTYTFDDSQPSQIEHYAQLQAVGIHVTFYVASGWANTSSRYDATWSQAVRDGHELGNHTVHHCRADLTGCSVAPPLGSALAELDAEAAYISQHNGQRVVATMASPFGDGNWATVARQRVFLSRDVNRAMVAPNDSTDPFHLPCFMAGDASIGGVGTQQSQFNGFIDTARSGNRWLIFLFHTITPTANNWFAPVDVGAVTGSMQHARSLADVWTDTLVNVGAYWRAQKLFSTLVPTRAGNVTTWTWTLPDHFPAGKFLRVKVDGGRLKQGTTALVWDPHGYYEVALDARVLTLSP